MHPVYLARSDKEKCLIEPSINSCRVIEKAYIQYNMDLD